MPRLDLISRRGDRTARVVGIDFDNTIIRYDEVFLVEASKQRLVPDGFAGSKQAIRDVIRGLPQGELRWQQLQGNVYSKGVSAAKPFEGVEQFLERCHSEDVRVCIVSHKTEVGHFDPDRINLRDAALSWLNAHSFLDDPRYGLHGTDVFWEPSQLEKLARIKALRCTVFIDDLEEVFVSGAFPRGVTKILFAPEQEQVNCASLIRCGTWGEIEAAVFDGDG